MERDGLISVIIPVYNVEKYLRQCVDSVLAQTYQNIEIILVDDGSTDSSGAICDEYRETCSNVVVIHQANGGASAARNAGIRAAKSEYVYFMDSDDYLANTALYRLVQAINNGENDFSFFEAFAVDETTGEESKGKYTYHKNYGTGDAKLFFSEMVKNQEFHVAVWLYLFRKSFLTKNQMGFSEAIMYEDLVFAYQIFQHATSAAHVNECLYWHRYRKNSVMKTKKSPYKFKSAVCAYDQVFREAERQNFPKGSWQFLSRAAFNVINNYSVLHISDKKECKERYREFKKKILSENAYGDTALKALCYGKPIWFCYKCYDKTIGWVLQAIECVRIKNGAL